MEHNERIKTAVINMKERYLIDTIQQGSSGTSMMGNAYKLSKQSHLMNGLGWPIVSSASIITLNALFLRIMLIEW